MSAEVADEAATKPAKRSLGKMVLLGLNLMLFLAGAAFFLLTKFGILNSPSAGVDKGHKAQKEQTESHNPDATVPDKPAAESEPHSPGVTVPLQPFAINLGGDDGRRYLRLVLALDVKDEKAKAEIDKRLPHLRNLLIFLLSSKSFADINSTQGKYQLQAEISKALNETLGAPLVRKIYFTDFIVQ
jgi:flagellar FliL protein